MAIAAGAIRAGQAFVELLADDAKLARGLEGAQTRMQRFGAFVRRWGARIAAGGLAIGLALNKSVNDVTTLGDALHKMQLRTGASAEFLSQIAFAAEQSGASIDDLERGLRGMARFLEQAKRGSAEAVSALQSLGLTVDDLVGLSPDDQFLLLADALSRIPDPTERAAVAMRVFSESGAKLLPLVAGGAVEIRKMMQEADRLGRTMSQDNLDAAAAYRDELNRLRSVLQGIRQDIAFLVLPAFQKLAEGIRSITNAFREPMKSLILFKVEIELLRLTLAEFLGQNVAGRRKHFEDLAARLRREIQGMGGAGDGGGAGGFGGGAGALPNIPDPARHPRMLSFGTFSGDPRQFAFGGDGIGVHVKIVEELLKEIHNGVQDVKGAVEQGLDLK